jgi:hypothetical protein
MNKTKLAYWIFTVLFSAAMIFSSLGGLRLEPQAVQMLHDQMGYPIYFIQFISVAKIIGSIAILIPGLKTIKEWAYAGLFFDLLGASYSIYSVSQKFDPSSLGMLVFIGLGALSYYFWKKTTTA